MKRTLYVPLKYDAHLHNYKMINNTSNSNNL